MVFRSDRIQMIRLTSQLNCLCIYKLILSLWLVFLPYTISLIMCRLLYYFCFQSGRDDKAIWWKRNNCYKTVWWILSLGVLLPGSFLLTCLLLSGIGKLGDLFVQSDLCDYSDWSHFGLCVVLGFFSIFEYAVNIFMTSVFLAPLILLLFQRGKLDVLIYVLTGLGLLVSLYFPFFLGVPLYHVLFSSTTCNLDTYQSLVNLDCLFSGFLTTLIIGGLYGVISGIVAIIYCLRQCVDKTQHEMDNERTPLV